MERLKTDQARMPARGHHRATLALFAALILNACAPSQSGLDVTNGWLPSSSPKKLEVEQAKYRHVTYFDTDRDEVRADQRDRLLAFMDVVQLTSQDNLRLEGHADERASDIYNLDLASRRIKAVQEILTASGIDERRIQVSAFGEQAPVLTASDEAAWSRNRRVEIVVERYIVTPPACPDWSRRSGRDYTNEPHSNFGCATETNLGLMIANPRDLVRGRSSGQADSVHQAAGIARYREGNAAELREESLD